ncbi:hypothetical protein GGS26DRAFT_343351 [Hypomontagnella submonticulosa]|nr:hypothetical protein GGS26DRAFT_343351 [Hypomontagnella submonticulosa]
MHKRSQLRPRPRVNYPGNRQDLAGPSSPTMTLTSRTSPSDRCRHYFVWPEVCGTGRPVLDQAGVSCSSFSGFELVRILGSAVLDSHLPRNPGRSCMMSLLLPVMPIPSPITPTCQALTRSQKVTRRPIFFASNVQTVERSGERSESNGAHPAIGSEPLAKKHEVHDGTGRVRRSDAL